MLETIENCTSVFLWFDFMVHQMLNNIQMILLAIEILWWYGLNDHWFQGKEM